MSSRRIDLHCHSTHSRDGTLGVAELAAIAARKGLGGLALTDHDSVAGHGELAELAEEYPGLVLLPGIEISTARGHLLAYGIEQAPPKGRPLAETLEEVRDMGGVAVLAHPFRLGNGLSSESVAAAEGVAVEVCNGRSRQGYNRRAARLAVSLGRAATGGSDSHTAAELGSAWTLFPTVTDSREALAALAEGRVGAGGSGLGHLAFARSKARGLRRRLRRAPTPGKRESKEG